jgi:hypothetical protein
VWLFQMLIIIGVHRKSSPPVPALVLRALSNLFTFAAAYGLSFVLVSSLLRRS